VAGQFNHCTRPQFYTRHDAQPRYKFKPVCRPSVADVNVNGNVYKSIVYYYNLPVCIRAEPDITRFKNILKTYFTLAFDLLGRLVSLF